jgi:hypothetical protein
MTDNFNDDSTNDMWIPAPLTAELIQRVDKAVSIDFTVKEISDNDRSNPYYKAMVDMLNEYYHTKVLYERVVISSNKLLPTLQYLFGFKHKEGMCLILNKPMHKVIACSPGLERLNQGCFLINGLQFILHEVEQDKRWCYVPHCLCEHEPRCELTPHAMHLRRKLWDDRTPL